jgi:hypothetical protein
MAPPAHRPKTPADLAKARAAIDWIDDDDLALVEPRSPITAAALGFVSWGGGRLLARDFKKGLGALGALFAWVAASDYLIDPIGSTVWAVVGVFAAIWSYRGARAVNRYVGTRDALMLQAGLAAAARQLPAPAPVEATGPHAALVTRLRKLAALHDSDMLTDTELRERKVDLLTEAAPATRAELDDLLYALLPLVEEGVLDADDVAFLKQVGGDR